MVTPLPLDGLGAALGGEKPGAGVIVTPLDPLGAAAVCGAGAGAGEGAAVGAGLGAGAALRVPGAGVMVTVPLPPLPLEPVESVGNSAALEPPLPGAGEIDSPPLLCGAAATCGAGAGAGAGLGAGAAAG